MRLSQGHLSLLEICPRQFQYQFLEQLNLQNQSLEDEERLRSGSEFHQIIQQRSLQVPIEALLAKDPQLAQWFRAFERVMPDFFSSIDVASELSESEQVRTLTYLGHCLVVVYDYLILNPERALILDWKTYRKPNPSNAIVNSWQSKLYPYVLHQTSQYPAHHIELRYWFFHHDTAQKLSLPYTDAAHCETDRQLTHLLTQLNHWLSDYESHAIPFPQTPDVTTCKHCAYAVRCDRTMDKTEQPDRVIAWDQIPEVPSTLQSILQ